MARRPATLLSLGSSGEQKEVAGPSTLTPPHTAPAQEQRQGRQGRQEEGEEDEEEMGTPREQPGQEEREEGEEDYWEPPSIGDENASSAAGTTLSLDGVDGMEEEEEEEEEDEGGAGWSLEAEVHFVLGGSIDSIDRVLIDQLTD